MEVRKQPHYVETQAAAEADFLKKLDDGYSFQKPLCVLDLYGLAPLTALIGFDLPQAQSVRLTVKGRTPQADITHGFPAAKRQVLPVYGLYPAQENTVLLTLETGESTEVKITTGPLPPEILPRARVLKGGERFGDNVILLTIAQDNKPFAYDCNGDCRWYLTGNFNFDGKRIKNGHLLFGSCRKKLLYYSNGVMEVNAGGKIFCEYEIPGYYHHDQFEMPNGNFLICSEDADFKTVEDTVVEIDRATGAVVKEWDMKDYFPQYPFASSGTADAFDWAHINSVWYDEKTNSFIISCRHLDAVVNIDYATGKLNWILGDPEGWTPDYVEKYFFTPQGEDFEWPYEQHGVVLCGDGDIFCFDNHQWGAKNKENYIEPDDSYSRGVKYRIDTQTRTIRQVFQFGKERGAAFYSPYISNVEYLGPEHYIIHSGGVCFVNGKVLRGLGSRLRRTYGPEATRLSSVTVEIENGEVVMEMHTDINTYRAEKLPLYAENEVFEPGPGCLRGTLGETICSEPVPYTAAQEPLPGEYQATLTEEVERYKVTLTLPVNLEAYVLLCKGDEERFYKITTQPAFGSVVKEAPFDTYIGKVGLEGRYQIKILVDGKLYDTQTAI